MIAAPDVVERRRGDTGTDLGPRWRVIVLNDAHNTFEGVARMLADVIAGVDYRGGMAMANKIHKTGKAIVWTGHRELAELYHEQLSDRGLTMAPLEQT